LKIIFEELEPSSRGNSNGMLLKGRKTYDNSAYEKYYFDKTRDGDPTPLHKIAMTLKAGDTVELTYDDTKYKNLKGIEVVGAGGGSGGQTSGGSKSSGSGRSGGGAKSNYRDPDHTDRSSAMYLAWEIVSKMEGITGEKKIATKAQASISAQFEDLSKKLERFLHTGDFNCPAPAANEPGNDGQPASQVDDDDIPF
jgi:hypothetical protein